MIAPANGRGGPQRIPRPDTWSLGGPPPWNHTPENERAVDLEFLEQRLGTFEPRFDDRGMPDTGKRSAVLVPLYVEDGLAKVVLTRRSPALRSHTHEVSFPGGRVDDTDATLLDAALREAHEEVNLDRSAVRVIGELDRFVTGGSGSLVHPFVGVLDAPPSNLIANPDEVEEILYVGLNELLLNEVWREEMWQRSGDRWPVTFFELYGDTVWGATGNMLRQLLTIATDPG